MIMSRPILLARIFAKIFLRDRQAIMFMVIFPIVFMVALGMGSDYQSGPMKIGLVNTSNNSQGQNIAQLLKEKYQFILVQGSKEELMTQLDEKALSVIVIFPQSSNSDQKNIPIEIISDSSQYRQSGQIVASLRQAFLGMERELRNLPTLFEIKVADIQTRSLRYIDFLLPGILAMTLMQISIAGSGFNVVEYRRKGILKRLFVTPLQPKDFIAGVVMARLLLCLVQVSVLIAIAVFFLNVKIVGNALSLYFIVMLGSIIFLCLGFTLGSIAKTQQSIQALGNLVIFPQMLFSGIFYPIESLPNIAQPLASVLPLSFIASALREIVTHGVSIFAILPELLGIIVWLALGFFLAIRFFVWKDVAS